jgi:hypothetical protein
LPCQVIGDDEIGRGIKPNEACKT